ncbi:uncharacterized protein LOC143061985 [Mytilus galloprovincialis]|uniref:uncharacterized protein LOC143061985 n=1 Tax=Mytilus galloprovincialis TaxID=29158 RepID=UPI003F7BB8D0
MGFRTKKYAISTDIGKAFLHIGLDEKDRDFTRFFWLSDTDNPSSTLTTYRFKSILFGATSSPFILNATLLKHLDACNTNISEIMKNDLYVDNILSSLENEDDAAKYFVQARSLMSEAGFNLRSWSSNCSKLTDLAKQYDVCEKETFVKILGLKWDTVKDTITFQKVDLFDIELPNITKREILKQSSRIYDPLGLLSPVSVRAKILMQTLWEQKYEWDEPLPLEIQTTWKNLAKDLEKTTYTELKRPYFPNLPDQKTQLHVFVDASTTAYGATVYICNHHESSLVIAKNRVAPFKQLTLPQLELMAALIGARLADHVKSVLHIENITFWSDSQIILQWLSTSKQLKRFIRNRVTEIRKLTNTQEWRYCPTKDNPADLLTRGLSASQFEQNTLWFNGPEWISDASKWPSWKPNDTTVLLTSTDIEDSSTADKEIDNQQGIHQIVQITRYSTLSKLLRITAYLLRFIRNCRSPILQRNKAKYVSREELQDATECWILNCQRTSFKDEMLHLKLKDTKPTVLVRQLRLYLNNKDAICRGGRIHNAPVCENTKFPYLLPRSHHFTKLVVLDIHKYMKHSGVLSTVTQIRQTYWIPRIRQYVRGILRNCVICRKINSKPYTAPDPPPLPKVRLLEAPPFTITGVDFTGALYIRDTHDIEHKVFICLFTCASTRAVHLEVVPDLSEKSFLQAFRRFASRKSRPHTLISDNASTYLAASETLKKLTQSPSLNDTLSTYGTTWRFIPKRAPWYGGWWERFIGITKTCLKKTLGRSYVTMDTLQTILTEIEAIINDRPLTYVSPDIEDEEPLTPSHLLYGRRITLTPYPQPNIEYIAVNSGKQELHKHLNKQSSLMEHFWNRWKSEYITTLREFHRQTGNNLQTIQVGDVVQVQDDKLPKNRWNIAVVDELITGNDVFTRAAIIRTSAGRTSRPIVKLYPLEIRTNINNLDDNNDDSSTDRLTRVLPKREASVRARENIKKWTTQK